MTKKFLSTLIAAACAAILMASPAFAVLSTIDLNSGATPETLANALLGGGITVTNVIYNGDNVASGSFSGGTGVIGFESGIVLTSGSTANVLPPNNNTAATLDNSGGTNALLAGLIGVSSVFDAAVLTITFIPNGNQIQFSYVFGSEEYNEFLGFNDVFGFFVNGANRALVPGTNTPVSVSNVNCGSTGIGSGPNCGFFINNPAGTQLDGITQVLTLTGNVNPGVENTLILGIADAGDSILDSAVFIAGGSFQVCGGPGQPPCGGNGQSSRAQKLAASRLRSSRPGGLGQKAQS
jgi:hypothetical protein